MRQLKYFDISGNLDIPEGSNLDSQHSIYYVRANTLCNFFEFPNLSSKNIPEQVYAARYDHMSEQWEIAHIAINIAAGMNEDELNWQPNEFGFAIEPEIPDQAEDDFQMLSEVHQLMTVPLKYFNADGVLEIPEDSQLYSEFQAQKLLIAQSPGFHVIFAPVPTGLEHDAAPEKVYVSAGSSGQYFEYPFRDAKEGDDEINRRVQMQEIEDELRAANQAEHQHYHTMQHSQGGRPPAPAPQLDDPYQEQALLLQDPPAELRQRQKCWPWFKTTNFAYAMRKFEHNPAGRITTAFLAVWLLGVLGATVMAVVDLTDDNKDALEAWYNILTHFFSKDLDWTALNDSQEAELAFGEAPAIAAVTTAVVWATGEGVKASVEACIDCKKGPDPEDPPGLNY